MLRIKNLNKSFGGLQVLLNINIKVPLNMITGLIGPNGAGKTTLFNVISGLIKPDSGEINFFDSDLTKLNPEKICKKGISRTFQFVKTFDNLTVEKNIATGALNRCKNLFEANKKTEEILNFFKITNLKQIKAKNLTLCERKRLEMARALATEPKLLLLDEVMCGLNPTEILEIMELIKEIHESGIGIFMIEHIMSAIMDLSDHIIVLNNGKKLIEGVGKEIANNPEVIKAYLGEEFVSA